MTRVQQFPERNAEIIRRRKAGEWPTQIAKAMGLSRNTVIGALNRAGMCSPDTDRSIPRKMFGARGEAVGSAILTASDVRAIRREYQPYDPEFGRNALAKRYGVNPSAIHDVVVGDTWRHVS